MDDSGNREAAGAGIARVGRRRRSCPCPSLWSASTVPAIVDARRREPGRARPEVHAATSTASSRACASTRRRATPARTSATCGRAPARCWRPRCSPRESPSGWQEVLFDAPVADHREHDLCRVVSHQRRALLGVRRLLQQRWASTARRCMRRRPAPSAATASTATAPARSRRRRSTPPTTGSTSSSTARRTRSAPMIADVSATAIDGSTAVVDVDDRRAARHRASTTRPSSTFAAAQTLSASDAAFVTAHSVRLTGLTPSTAYFFRVRSTDRSGNEASKPSLGPAPPPVPGGPTAAAAAGLHDAEPDAARHDVGGLQRRHLDGHLCRGERRRRTHARARRRAASSPAPRCRPDGRRESGAAVARATVAGGKLTVDGARVATCVDVGGACLDQFNLVPGTSLEFVATFTGDPYQHSGLGQTLESSFEPFALFSTSWTDANGAFHSGGSLGLRTYNGSDPAGETRTNLGPGLLNAPHRFRIDWLPAQVVYSVDGVQVGNPRDGDYGVDAARGRQRLQRLQRHHRRRLGPDHAVRERGDVPLARVRCLDRCQLAEHQLGRRRAGRHDARDQRADGQHGGAGWHLERVRSGACLARSSLQSRYIQYRAEMATADAHSDAGARRSSSSAASRCHRLRRRRWTRRLRSSSLGAKTFGDPAFAVTRDVVVRSARQLRDRVGSGHGRRRPRDDHGRGHRHGAGLGGRRQQRRRQLSTRQRCRSVVRRVAGEPDDHVRPAGRQGAGRSCRSR